MLLSRSPIATTDSRTRIDFYSSRALVSSHSRKLANAQTERSVAATSAVLVTESVLSSTYQHCYWMRWESLYRKNDFTTLYRVRRWYLIIQLLSYYLYVACAFMQGYLMTDIFIVAWNTRVPECLYYLCLFHMHPDSRAATRTRPDSYSLRAFVSSHSRKLANAQTERSLAATSAVLVTESKLGSGYLFCYVAAENWIITIRLNFIAICGIILLISIKVSPTIIWICELYDL